MTNIIIYNKNIKEENKKKQKMNKILLTLLGVAAIFSIGLTIGLSFANSDNNLEITGAPSPYITFVDNDSFDTCLQQLVGQPVQKQLDSIREFLFQQRKFIRGVQILQILSLFKRDGYALNISPRDEVIVIMKAYIAPLTTEEAIQIIQSIGSSNGIGSSIIISQIYDLENQQNQANLKNTIASYQNVVYNHIAVPQQSKNFQQNFLITSEGGHVGFIVDQSKSMAQVAYTAQDGTKVTRYDLLKNFFINKSDILQSYTTFSFLFMGSQNQNYKCIACAVGSYEYNKSFNSYVYNILYNQGDSNLYSTLEQLLSDPYSTLSEVFIFSDGIITEGTSSVNDFTKLISKTNVPRRNKIRINTVSFLIGGEEDDTVKQEATKLLQTLADVTGGTFIQISLQQ
ncbi:von willebrand factor type A domain protein (macronuclear) [Tetrahymena thermophila SB210]|uniref:von willebrand factor type A domain protein n=1 Tax=Tetrahymena thermophila (strain SB210) TaxID=312017 RepID=Q245Z2_TETTS|nr:von willebrand factor type A domain protein [Tetrahymena thermophila SB210]EAS03491.2 von willebrand factor type A domain protein [Tetrahymena thermophila SB210]|eukprot:XP_001023736.2 von willebrand factor type A domain protein [Tetrahymena thermophila SB210]